jgi:hypothetical protein
MQAEYRRGTGSNQLGQAVRKRAKAAPRSAMARALWRCRVMGVWRLLLARDTAHAPLPTLVSVRENPILLEPHCTAAPPHPAPQTGNERHSPTGPGIPSKSWRHAQQRSGNTACKHCTLHTSPPQADTGPPHPPPPPAPPTSAQQRAGPMSRTPIPRWFEPRRRLKALQALRFCEQSRLCLLRSTSYIPRSLILSLNTPAKVAPGGQQGCQPGMIHPADEPCDTHCTGCRIHITAAFLNVTEAD